MGRFTFSIHLFKRKKAMSDDTFDDDKETVDNSIGVAILMLMKEINDPGTLDPEDD